jgi:hypothetical protein
MRLLPAGLLAFALLDMSASAAFADQATTYAGTIGKASIIVELQAPGKDGAFVGRYSYMIKGVDIPLHGTDAKGRFTIEEEKPCTEDICWTAKNQVEKPTPIGAEWSLKPTSSGDGFEGTWTDKDSGKSLPIKLAKKGMRTLSGTDLDPTSIDYFFDAGEDQMSVLLSPKDLPYDFLKLDHPLKKGKVVKIDDSAYRMDLDSRSGLSFPTVIKLGKADPATLNRGLLDQRRRWSEIAFDCLSKVYHGNGWVGIGVEGTTGLDGAEVSVDYLTPRLMGFTESGDQDCGSPHPNHLDEHYLVDAKTGRPVTDKDLLADWVARDLDGKIVDPTKAEDPTLLTWGPGDKLLDYLDKNRYASPEGADVDDGVSDDCRTDENMHGNVGVYFKGKDLIFALVNMRYEDTGCAAILTKLPIKDAKPFLTKAGAAYFAEFDR